MKEECKLCSVNGWGAHGSTDFSISSLMRPTAHHQPSMDPRQDAVLLSAYLLKLGDYPLYSLHDYAPAGRGGAVGEYRSVHSLRFRTSSNN